MVLDWADPARERRVNGAGIAEAEVDELVRDKLLLDRPRKPAVEGFGSERSSKACESFCAPSGEFRIASAITSTRGGVRVDSYNPYCGRGGRSGVDLSLLGSGTEADRWRFVTGLFSLEASFWFDAGDHSGVLGVAYS